MFYAKKDWLWSPGGFAWGSSSQSRAEGLEKWVLVREPKLRGKSAPISQPCNPGKVT